VLGVYGEHDNIVDPQQVELLTHHVPRAQAVTMKRSRHFPMLDEPEQFNAAVRLFLAS
jgi:2-hydroxy-6-oxo-octa-2,4-dienoate hydrolase